MPRHNLKKLHKASGKKLSKELISALYLMAVLAFVFFTKNSYNSLLEKKHLEMSKAASEIESEFVNTLRYAESILNYINHQVSTTKGGKDEIVQVLKSFDQSFESYNSIKDTLSVGMFYWIDSTKHLVASNAGTVTSPIDLSGRDYLVNTEANPGIIQTGSPTIGVVSGQYVIPAGVGYVNGSNKYVGTSVASFVVNSLAKKFTDATASYNINFTILDKTNQLLVAGGFQELKMKQSLSELLQSFEESSEEKILTDFEFFDEESSYTLARNIPNYPYKIAVSYPNKLLARDALCAIIPHLIELLIVTVFFVIAFRRS